MYGYYGAPPPNTVPGIADDEVDYPLLSDWLKQLDDHPKRGRDQFNYAKYTADFTRRSFIRLNQIADTNLVTVDNLMSWFGIEPGVGGNILRYASEDVKRLKAGRF